ncbi:MAG TPA: SRPBCC family protein [Ktedonobacterales bacterium]|nr:SRPBCC family protein [Ktedonobacterales bacterium]
MQTSATMRAPTGPAIAFDESIEVPAPVSEVYRRWSDFGRFPEFMDSVQEVRPLGGGRYHWVARILGGKQEWDAEVTDQQENHHVSWKSISGAPNKGTVTLQPLPNNRTRVDLRMEYTPPGGMVGHRLDKLTGTTQREVRKSLENFRRVVSGERIPGKEEPGFTNVLSALAIPAATGAIGGLVSYLVERKQHPIRSRMPMMWRGRAMNPVDGASRTAGNVLTTAAAASLITSAIFRARRNHMNDLFVGQWVPTFLAGSILARLVGHRGVKPTLGASVTSWAFTGAAAGSILSSIIAHLRSTRHEGLFIGQWAPSLMAGAIFARLFNRW